MDEISLPDKVIKKIRIPVLGYNTFKFVIYIVVGIGIGLVGETIFRSWMVFYIVMVGFLFMAFVFSIIRINGEVDLDVYLFSFLLGREKAVTGDAASRLVNVDGFSKDHNMLKVRGSYIVIMEVTGDTVAVMSDDRALWYFEGFVQYLKQASSKIVASIVTLPARYDPSSIVSELKPRAGTYYTDLLGEYKEYLRSFNEIRVYTGLVILRLNPSVLFSGRDVRGVNMEQSAGREFEFEVEKVARNFGSKGMSVRLIVGDELVGVGKMLYQGGL